MVICYIQNCKSRSGKGDQVRFFSLPRDATVAEQWLQHCRQGTTHKSGARVCSKHFTKSDYLRLLRHNLMNEEPTRLKPDAVPSLNLSVNHSFIPLIKEDHTKLLKDVDTNDKCLDNGIATINIPVSEYEALKSKIAKLEKKNNILQENLYNIFTPGQIRCLLKGGSRVVWCDEDIAAAISLRSISPKAYRHLRTIVGLPLPGHSTLCKWIAKYRNEEGNFPHFSEVDEEEE